MVSTCLAESLKERREMQGRLKVSHAPNNRQRSHGNQASEMETLLINAIPKTDIHFIYTIIQEFRKALV